MSNILDDIVEDVVIKPSKTKIIIKWILRIAIFAIIAAFIIGEFKVIAINKINDIEKNGVENKNAIIDLENEMNSRLDKIDNRINDSNKRIDAIYEKIISK
jgi:hypothetical protein